jgi:hypothetical protein
MRCRPQDGLAALLNMEGKYRIGTHHIRAQALICHALDLQFDRLFNQETICEKSTGLVDAYERLFATTLLNLAISIRVGLGDTPEYRSPTSGVSASVLFERDPKGRPTQFSIKDVCDKIIHADDIFKPPEIGVRGAACTLRGNQAGNQWQLHIGVTIFCEVVLAWLDRIEATA